MKGLILAAGKGSRLSELKIEHKSIIQIHKKHLIDFGLDVLVGSEENPLVSEIVIVVGWHAEAIMNYLGDNYRGVKIRYAFQKELKGVAHAVLCAKELLQDDFIMYLADEILLNPRIKEMRDYFISSNSFCTCGIIHDGNDFSMKPIAYECDNQNCLISITEKPKAYTNDIRGLGECFFKKEALTYLEELKPNALRGELEMGDWIRMLVEDKRKVTVFDIADGYVNVNYASDISRANEMLK